MIAFQPEWASRMRAPKHVPERVQFLIADLREVRTIYFRPTVTFSTSINLALALVCRRAKDITEAAHFIDHLIDQLKIVQANMLRTYRDQKAKSRA